MRISLIMVFAMFGIFLTFAVTSMVTFDLSIQEVKKLLGVRNEGFAFNMMQGLDQNVEKRLSDLKDITKLNVVQNTLKESNEFYERDDDAQSLISQREIDAQLPIQEPSFINPGDRIPRELMNTIQFYKNEYDYDVVEELFLSNKFGANVVLGTGTSEYRQDKEEWWQTAQNTGLSVGELQYRTEYDSYATTFGFKVEDEEGNFLGVMRVVLTLDDMIHPFVDDSEILTLPNRHIVLLDNQGRIIYSEGVQNFTQSKPVPYFKNLVKEKDVGTIEFFEDEDRIISYAKSTGYKTFQGFGWTVLVDQASSSFVEEFVDLKNSLLLISIVGMISSVLIGMVVSFFITKPLKDLSSFAKFISKGKFNVRVKESKIDEIDVIGESFNKMSASLKKLIETEKQLAEAQAKVKNERLTGIGEIAASMAHNIKNPLGTIRTSADIVKRHSKGSNKEIDLVLDRMDRAIDRVLNQIEDVLNFVRVTPLNIQMTSIKKLLNNAMESITIPKNITIQTPQIDLPIKCDSKKIEIVFINLLLNAIQAIGKEQGKIIIRTHKDQNFTIIEIEDSGSGIPEEIRPKIFEPLVTSKEKGTGLGLSTCKNIIEQHGGFISAKNDPTTFTVRLPLND